MTQKKTDFLGKAGRTLLKNADYAMAGLCFTFALAATPVLTNMERGNYWMKPYYGGMENAKEIYADARSDALTRLQPLVTAEEHAAADAMDKNTLNAFLYEKRGDGAEWKEISDLHWHGVTPLRHAEKTRDMNKAFGTAAGISFALLGAAFAAGGISRNMRRRKPQKPVRGL
jgi:hypothetical protein